MIILQNMQAVGSSSRFLLLFFLSFPLAAHCTKRSFSKINNSDDNSLHIIKKIKRITIQELKKERDALAAELKKQNYNNWDDRWLLKTCMQPKYNHSYQPSSHPLARYLAPINVHIPFYCTIHTLKDIRFKQATYQQYSAVGVACISQQLSFQEKKEFIQRLIVAGCKATKKDKNLAYVEKWERTTPSIIATICSLQNSSLLSELDIPQDVIQNIVLLMWQTEVSLL